MNNESIGTATSAASRPRLPLRTPGQQAAAVEPDGDQVLLGSPTVEPALPPPAPAVVAPAAAAEESPSTTTVEPAVAEPLPSPPAVQRHALCQHLAGLRVGLQQKQLDADSQNSALCLASQLANSGPTDPLTRRVARYMLMEGTGTDHSLQVQQLRWGAVGGACRLLRKLDRDMGVAADEEHFDQYDVRAAVEALRDPPVTQETLRAVVHTANRLAERTRRSLPALTRSHEPVALNRLGFEACTQLLNDWWAQGRIEVQQSGARLRPGQADLTQCLSAERLAVEGTTVHLDAPTTRAAEDRKKALEVGGRIQQWPHMWDAGNGLDELLQMPLEEGQRMFGILLQEAVHDSTLNNKMSAVIYESGKHPGLEQLLAPHVDGLMHVVSRLDARGLLNTGQPNKEAAGLLCSIMQRYPDRVDTAWAEREVGPLLRAEDDTDTYNTAMRGGQVLELMFKDRPDLTSSVADLLFAEPGRLGALSHGRVGNDNCILYDASEKHGWRPTPHQLAHVAADLVPPAGEPTFLEYGQNACTGFNTSLSILCKVHESEPQALNGLEMLTPQAEVVPLKEGLLQHLLVAPFTHERYKYTSMAIEKGIKLLFPDAALEDRLLGWMEDGFATTPSLSKMSSQQQAAVMLLSMAQLSGERAERFEALLEKGMHSRHDNATFADLYDQRRMERMQPAIDRMNSGTLSAAELLDNAREALSYVHTDRSTYCGFRADKVFEALKQQWQALPPGSSSEAAFQDLMREVTPQVAQAPSLGDLSPRDLAAVNCLVYVAKENEALQDQLLPCLQPQLTVEQPYDGWLFPYREKTVNQNLQRLHQESLPPAERVVLLERNHSITECANGNTLRMEALGRHAILSGALERAGQKVYTDQLKPIYDLYDALHLDRQDDTHIVRAYGTFMRLLEECGGGETAFELAAKCASYVEQAVAAGHSQHRAMEHAMTSLSLGRDPAEMKEGAVVALPAGTIERGPKQLKIAGVNIPVRAYVANWQPPKAVRPNLS